MIEIFQGIVSCAVAVVCLVLFVRGRRLRRRLKQHGKRAQGVVVSKPPTARARFGNRRTWYRYEDDRGHEYVRAAPAGWARKGKQIEVLYDPDDPQSAMPEFARGFQYLLLMIGVFGLLNGAFLIGERLFG